MPFVNRVAHEVSSRMEKRISPRGHAIADCLTIGAFFLGAAFFWNRNRRAALGSLICGGAELAVSLLSDYPAGITPQISFRSHGKMDRGLAALSAIMPEALGFRYDPERNFFLAESAAKIVVVNLTDFSRRRALPQSSRRAA
jgi:hypothetical protein